MAIQPPKYRVVELLKATESERKSINRVVSTIMTARGISYEKIYAAANGSMAGFGLEDKKNLGRGSISQPKAAKLFRWIVENHLPLGCEIAPEVFDPSLLTQWRGFLNDHGQYDRLHHEVLGQMGLTERSSKHPIAETPIRLGQEYLFGLDCGIQGQLLTLERTGGHTYPFSLHANQTSVVIDIQKGKHTLPLDQFGNPDPLMERDDVGLRCYTFLIASPETMNNCIKSLHSGHPIGLDKLDQMALASKGVDPATFEVHCLNVIFK